MGKVEEYSDLRIRIVQARAWCALIGQTYSGGGGGVGDLRSVEVNATVYHQERDGSKNYHEAPSLMRQALAAVIKRHATEIIHEALADLEADRLALAAQARDEYAKLMAEAGLAAEATP